MYEINPLVFSASRDFAGIMPRLDSIKDLGVNVIWLMPVYEMGTLNSVGSPYCIKDYKSLNPIYGDLDDLRELVDSAHAKGMAVMMDWVANHTSWDHIWMADEKLLRQAKWCDYPSSRNELARCCRTQLQQR